MTPLVFKKTSFHIHPDLCFVIMPFSKEFTDLYEDHIKPLVNNLGFSSLRGDELFGTGIIIDDIWEHINRANFLIADVTGRSPNVFYELGLAHAIGKDVIILTRTMDDVPFDTKHIRHIVYQFTPRGVKKLENELEATIRNLQN
jgi:hypothetical protein